MYNYDLIIRLPNLPNHCYLVSVLYRIKNEMIEKNVHKISDKNNNYILIYSSHQNELIVEDLNKMVEWY